MNHWRGFKVNSGDWNKWTSWFWRTSRDAWERYFQPSCCSPSLERRYIQEDIDHLPLPTSPLEVVSSISFQLPGFNSLGSFLLPFPPSSLTESPPSAWLAVLQGSLASTPPPPQTLLAALIPEISFNLRHAICSRSPSTPLWMSFPILTGSIWVLHNIQSALHTLTHSSFYSWGI